MDYMDNYFSYSSDTLGTNSGEMHALSLTIIRSVVVSLGGTVTQNAETNTIDIDVPIGQGNACARQIEQQVDAMCNCMYTELTALVAGNLIVGFNLN